jgi:hypothetical protein
MSDTLFRTKRTHTMLSIQSAAHGAPCHANMPFIV